MILGVAASLGAVFFVGCTSSVWVGLGPDSDGCSLTAPCSEGNLCVEGECLPRGWYQPTEEVEDVVESIDVAGVDVPPLEDLQPVDSGELDSEGDAAQPDGDGPDLDTTDVGGSETVNLLIKDDSGDEALGGQFVSVAPGEAWVADIDLPLDGDVLGFQMILVNVLDEKSCGIFRPMLFFQQEGEFPNEPDWIGSDSYKLPGGNKLQNIYVKNPISVSAGAYRVGLLYDEPCVGDANPPLLSTDASGDVDGSWYWNEEPGQSPWIPGDFLQLEGRWVLRVILQVTL